MNDELFAELLESVHEGGAILRREKAPSHNFEIEPPDAMRIREDSGIPEFIVKGESV